MSRYEEWISCAITHSLTRFDRFGRCNTIIVIIVITSNDGHPVDNIGLFNLSVSVLEKT